MTARRVARAVAGMLAVPLGLIVTLGLMDMLRAVPGPSLALALPLRETGHDDGVSVFVVAGVSALVFALVSGSRRRPPQGAGDGARALAAACSPARSRCRRSRSSSCARRRMGFAWGAAAASPSPYVCALGALIGTAAAQTVASSDRWRRRGLQERPVDGPTKAPPLAKIGS